MAHEEGVSSRNLRKSADVSRILLREEVKAQTKKVRQALKIPENDRTDEDVRLLTQSPEIVKTIEKSNKVRHLNRERKLEVVDPDHVLKEKCQSLATIIKKAESLVVYTGAGISTAASIPDYRGPNGVWTLLRQGLQPKAQDLSDAEPTFTHMSLVRLQQLGMVKYIVSQNCDGLHLRSGFPSSRLSEVHGNMYTERCTGCSPPRQYIRLFDATERTGIRRHGTGRECHDCGGQLRDTIVHFGEKGDLGWPHNWDEAADAADEADVIICLGSSLKVLKCYPCLWYMHKPAADRPTLCIINLQWTPKDDLASLKISGHCDVVMRMVMDILEIDVPEYKRTLDPIFAMATPLSEEEQSTTSKNVLQRPLEYAIVDVKDYKPYITKAKSPVRRRKPCDRGQATMSTDKKRVTRARKGKPLVDHSYGYGVEDTSSEDDSDSQNTRRTRKGRTGARGSRLDEARTTSPYPRRDRKTRGTPRDERKPRGHPCTGKRSDGRVDAEDEATGWGRAKRRRIGGKAAAAHVVPRGMEVIVDVCKLDIQRDQVNLLTEDFQCANLKKDAVTKDSLPALLPSFEDISVKDEMQPESSEEIATSETAVPVKEEVKVEVEVDCSLAAGKIESVVDTDSERQQDGVMKANVDDTISKNNSAHVSGWEPGTFGLNIKAQGNTDPSEIDTSSKSSFDQLNLDTAGSVSDTAFNNNHGPVGDQPIGPSQVKELDTTFTTTSRSEDHAESTPEVAETTSTYVQQCSENSCLAILQHADIKKSADGTDVADATPFATPVLGTAFPSFDRPCPSDMAPAPVSQGSEALDPASPVPQESEGEPREILSQVVRDSMEGPAIVNREETSITMSKSVSPLNSTSRDDSANGKGSVQEGAGNCDPSSISVSSPSDEISSAPVSLVSHSSAQKDGCPAPIPVVSAAPGWFGKGLSMKKKKRLK